MFSKNSLIPLLVLLSFSTACHGEKKKEAAPTPAATTEAKPEKTEAPAAPTLNASTPVDGVKGFYDAVSKEQYDIAWASLSKASQDKFISMVAEDEKLDPAKVRELFSQNQTPIRIGFWRSFRNSSKLDIVAPGATYKLVNESPDQAEVEMSSGEVVLKSKAFKEDGQWKMGYVETFLP